MGPVHNCPPSRLISELNEQCEAGGGGDRRERVSPFIRLSVHLLRLGWAGRTRSTALRLGRGAGTSRMGPALRGEAAVGYQQHLPHHPALPGSPHGSLCFPKFAGEVLAQAAKSPCSEDRPGTLGKE